MYSGCGGYGWCVNVGGDHRITSTYAGASGGRRRVAPGGARADAGTGSDDDSGGADPSGQRDTSDCRPRVPSARTVSDGHPARTPPVIDDRDFREFVRERSRTMLRAAYLLTGNRADAEDLVQSVLAKTYLAWDRIEDRAALDGYVRRAMVNTHISWWRRRRVEEFPTDEVPDQAVADQSADSDMQEPLRRAIARLPQRMRDAVMLRYYEDMTEAEVAEVLGVSLGTVKSTVSRAVAKLRIDADLQPE
jgi:RNA polymerase sigma-70 factor (sigma-E family)